MTQPATSTAPVRVSAAAIAAQYGVSARTIYRLAEAGKIPRYQVGRQMRFDPEEVGIALRTQEAVAASA